MCLIDSLYGCGLDLLCALDDDVSFSPHTEKHAEKTSLTFTYSVIWHPSEVAWASRWDSYLRMSDVQIHWFAICNSVAIVLFLSGEWYIVSPYYVLCVCTCTFSDHKYPGGLSNCVPNTLIILWNMCYSLILASSPGLLLGTRLVLSVPRLQFPSDIGFMGRFICTK